MPASPRDGVARRVEIRDEKATEMEFEVPVVRTILRHVTNDPDPPNECYLHRPGDLELSRELNTSEVPLDRPALLLPGRYHVYFEDPDDGVDGGLHSPNPKPDRCAMIDIPATATFDSPIEFTVHPPRGRRRPLDGRARQNRAVSIHARASGHVVQF